jgi:hypothetical protein
MNDSPTPPPVARYSMIITESRIGRAPTIGEYPDADGRWVEFSDHSRLAAECERLRAAAERARQTFFSFAQNPQLSMAIIEKWSQESHDDLRDALTPTSKETEK